MTVADLIKALSELSPNVKVFSLGYESGYDEVVRVDLKKIKDVSNEKQPWDGTHQEDEHAEVSVVLQTNRRY